MVRELTFAGAVYDRTQGLIDGTVRPEGLALNWLPLPYHEIWTRMLNHYDFDASEMSLSSYIIARSLGKPLIAIPVFPLRVFRHSYILVNENSGIRVPRDLEGKRIGLAEFQQTATVWVRGILQHEHGVRLEMIDWFAWSRQSRMEIEIPKRYNLKQIPHGKKPDEMLQTGELDAMICSTIFPSLINDNTSTRRLFENYQEEEISYYRKTGVFPIMHTVVINEELFKQYPWIAVSLYKGFQAAKELAYERLKDVSRSRISLVWYEETLRQQRSILGQDPWAYGLGKNEKTIETFVGYLAEQGLITQKMSLESYFASNTLTLE